MAYDLEKSIGFKINQTANKINNKFNYILQSYDIAPEQRATLEIIKYEKPTNILFTILRIVFRPEKSRFNCLQC